MVVIIKLGWCCWVSFGVKSFRNAFEADFASGSFRHRANRNASRPTSQIQYSLAAVIVKFFAFVSLCFVGEQVAMAQITPSTNVPLSQQPDSGAIVARPGFNSDPRILRDIVTSEAAKRNSKAIEFGMWVGNSKILTMALGDSMTNVPALTTMHYRIGGIAETFMSTLLLILVKQHRIDLDWTIGRWFPGLLAADQVTFRMLVADTIDYLIGF